jgi:hypothetical protein
MKREILNERIEYIDTPPKDLDKKLKKNGWVVITPVKNLIIPNFPWITYSYKKGREYSEDIKINQNNIQRLTFRVVLCYNKVDHHFYIRVQESNVNLNKKLKTDEELKNYLKYTFQNDVQFDDVKTWEKNFLKKLALANGNKPNTQVKPANGNKPNTQVKPAVGGKLSNKNPVITQNSAEMRWVGIWEKFLTKYEGFTGGDKTNNTKSIDIAVYNFISSNMRLYQNNKNIDKRHLLIDGKYGPVHASFLPPYYTTNNNFPIYFYQKSDKIKQLQKVLRVKVTGIFLTLTERAVIKHLTATNSNLKYYRGGGITEEIFNYIVSTKEQETDDFADTI